jgi:hypothetical protein
MKRILASVAVLGLMASPALAATSTAKPAVSQAKQTKPTNKKVAAKTAQTKAKTTVKTNHKKAK